MIGKIHITENGWVVKFTNYNPKMVGNSWDDELPIHPNNLNDKHNPLYVDKSVMFEIVKDRGHDVAKLYFNSPHAGVSKMGTGPGVKKSTKKINPQEDWLNISDDLKKFCDENGYTNKPLMTVMPLILEYFESKYEPPCKIQT
jgi:hypothetical protein